MSQPASGRGTRKQGTGAVGRPPARGPRGSESTRQLGEVAGFGLTMALATALFAWLGSLLDDRLGTKPLLVLVGAFVGFGAGFYSMYSRLVLRGRESDEAPGSAERDEAAADDPDRGK